MLRSSLRRADAITIILV